MSRVRMWVWVVVGFLMIAGCGRQADSAKPKFDQFDVSQLDVTAEGTQSAEVLDALIRSSGSSAKQKFNCPWWSDKCWCAGGTGSTDCNKLLGSARCGSNPIVEGESAHGRGLSGTCLRGEEVEPCNDYYTGACE